VARIRCKQNTIPRSPNFRDDNTHEISCTRIPPFSSAIPALSPPSFPYPTPSGFGFSRWDSSGLQNRPRAAPELPREDYPRSFAFPIDRGRSHSSKVPPIAHTEERIDDVIARHY